MAVFSHTKFDKLVFLDIAYFDRSNRYLSTESNQDARKGH